MCLRRRKWSRIRLLMTLLFAYLVFDLCHYFTLTPTDLSPVTCTEDLLLKPMLVSEQEQNGSVEHITCQQILFGNDNDTVYEIARDIMTAHPMTYIDDEQFVELTADCAEFRRRRGYHLSPLNQEEAEFSIAYNIIMHRHVEQVGTY